MPPPPALELGPELDPWPLPEPLETPLDPRVPPEALSPKWPFPDLPITWLLPLAVVIVVLPLVPEVPWCLEPLITCPRFLDSG